MVMHNGEKSKFSKSSVKSAGVGRHFICHRYWWGIKPRPTRNEPDLFEKLRKRQITDRLGTHFDIGVLDLI